MNSCIVYAEDWYETIDEIERIKSVQPHITHKTGRMYVFKFFIVEQKHFIIREKKRIFFPSFFAYLWVEYFNINVSRTIARFKFVYVVEWTNFHSPILARCVSVLPVWRVCKNHWASDVRKKSIIIIILSRSMSCNNWVHESSRKLRYSTFPPMLSTATIRQAFFSRWLPLVESTKNIVLPLFVGFHLNAPTKHTQKVRQKNTSGHAKYSRFNFLKQIIINCWFINYMAGILKLKCRK